MHSPIAVEIVLRDHGRPQHPARLVGTSVPGVYAAGNLTSLTETAIGSAAAGLKAAAALDLDLITEDTRRAVAAQAVAGA
ncbi:hypothetical protein ACFYO5_23600 [Streptomyces sp. NPDC006259]|uniref:hypothetical protein n=1 Tax=Streptomyces sp. NPDC006259 TaxID=3364740 RepID=UPI00368BB27D